MGRYLTVRAARHRAGSAPRVQVIEGALDVGVGCALSVAVACVVRRAVTRLPGVARPVAEGALLSTLLAERMLTREVLATDRALDEGARCGPTSAARSGQPGSIGATWPRTCDRAVRVDGH